MLGDVNMRTETERERSSLDEKGVGILNVYRTLEKLKENTSKKYMRIVYRRGNIRKKEY